MASSSPTPTPPRNSERRGGWYLATVFGAVIAVVLASYVAYVSLPPRTARADNVVFSRPSVFEGNASFVVERVSGGPYPHTGFRVSLTVNGFSSGSAPLPASGVTVHLAIGPNVYLVAWEDADADDAVSVGDSWTVAGHDAPLPTLSLYEFDLDFQGLWTAKAFWSTT
jgi:hypothetical protein